MNEAMIVFLALSVMLVARFGINGAAFLVRNRAGWLSARIGYHYWMMRHHLCGLLLVVLKSRLVEKMFTSHLAHIIFGRVRVAK